MLAAPTGSSSKCRKLSSTGRPSSRSRTRFVTRQGRAGASSTKTSNLATQGAGNNSGKAVEINCADFT